MKMKRIALTVAIVGLSATAAFGLYRQTDKNVVFYHEVDEYLADVELQSKPKLRVSGVVRAGTITRDAEAMKVNFAIEGTTKDLNVVYVGPVPDIFKDGVQVVVEGGQTQVGGPFVAETLLAKCPSKYQKTGEESDFQDVKLHPMDPSQLKY